MPLLCWGWPQRGTYDEHVSRNVSAPVALRLCAGCSDIAQEKRHYALPKATRGEPVGVVLPQSVGRDAMGVDWMNMDELSEAIPPAYTEWIGNELMRLLSTVGGSGKP